MADVDGGHTDSDALKRKEKINNQYTEYSIPACYWTPKFLNGRAGQHRPELPTIEARSALSHLLSLRSEIT